MPLISRRSPARSRGFTLIEALIALAVLSVGLLGSAALLLDSLRIQSGSLRRVAASNLVRDMADRLRAQSAACAVPACDFAGLLAAERLQFAQAARAVLPADARAEIEFEPAIGPAALHRFAISLRWQDPRDDADNTVTLQLLAAPVAG